MNVLVLSAGKRVKIVRYLQRALAGSGRVIVTDCSALAPSLYVADGAHVVPRADCPDYVDTILEICEREAIGPNGEQGTLLDGVVLVRRSER